MSRLPMLPICVIMDQRLDHNGEVKHEAEKKLSVLLPFALIES